MTIWVGQDNRWDIPAHGHLQPLFEMYVRFVIFGRIIPGTGLILTSPLSAEYEAGDWAANSTAFVEFMLHVIRDALNDLMQTEQVREQVTDQVGRLMSALGGETLSPKELLERCPVP